MGKDRRLRKQRAVANAVGKMREAIALQTYGADVIERRAKEFEEKHGRPPGPDDLVFDDPALTD